ncbi:unnamed protein product [Soboliphyme baturini]|uniref:Nuclear pore complex protein Nup85 n=1 Tax=Soboliphyme baturini TaxID=241478 RepID=A0A183J049_9BILA|nr:unnamed protein product [Soboliphyme baturini]
MFLKPLHGRCREKQGSYSLTAFTDWGTCCFPEIEDFLREILQKRSDAVDDEKYWSMVFLCLMLGRIDELEKLLSCSANKTDECYLSIIELLKKCPLKLKALSGTTLSSWYFEVFDQLESGRYASCPRLEQIIRVFADDETVYHELSPLCLNWKQVFISRSIYSSASFDASCLMALAEFAMKTTATKTLDVKDEIFLAVFSFDPIRLLHKLCQSLHNWWLPAHLADMFRYSDFFSGDLRRHKLKNMLERISIPSDYKALKLVGLCRSLNFTDLALDLCRNYSYKYLKEGKINCAFKWCLASAVSYLTYFKYNVGVCFNNHSSCRGLQQL